MFCPLKLYLQHNLNKEIEDEMTVNKGIKDLRIDLQDITQRNIRKVKKDMEIPKIEEILSNQVEDYQKCGIQGCYSFLSNFYDFTLFQ